MAANARGDNFSGVILACAVGNTRTRAGLFRGEELVAARSALNTDPAELRSVLAELMRETSASDAVPVIAGVNPRALEAAATAMGEAAERGVLRIGDDLPVPLTHTLTDASTLGQDRALCALAAAKRAEQACVVVDAGTAITVDFIDGEGVFHGGVIAPGLRMMLKSLHTGTGALPDLDFEAPEDAEGPYGKSTRHAMLLGVVHAAKGLVRYTVERFAETYQAYPQIIATGGDAPTLFENDEVVEHIVPDLQLMGILEACKAATPEAE
ncbi:MAG TPA: type III pantothenate kinase [Phycisphaerales bacterium]|nr:type III pantothenate kinase [Phycisphaerales bacterium]